MPLFGKRAGTARLQANPLKRSFWRPNPSNGPETSEQRRDENAPPAKPQDDTAATAEGHPQRSLPANKRKSPDKTTGKTATVSAPLASKKGVPAVVTVEITPNDEPPQEHFPTPAAPSTMSTHPTSDEEAVAAADKEMEARANRAKELLSQRYVGIQRQQVRCVGTWTSLALLSTTHVFRFSMFLFDPLLSMYYVCCCHGCLRVRRKTARAARCS